MEDIELIYEELLGLEAFSHFSTVIKRQLAAVLVFESHPAAGTVCMYRKPYLNTLTGS